MPRYVEYLHNQTRELIQKYGPLGIMWFDGEWEKPWTHAYGLGLYRHIRALQPDILINNRVDKGRRGMEGSTASNRFVGDYDTPEQRVGGFSRQRPWESCITICRQWAWKPNDRLKTRKECIQTLLQVAGGDGNLLLNVGPMPDGRIEPRQVQRLVEIGAWLDKFGAGVHGTRGGPFKPGPWGASTCKNNTIYLYIMDWPAAGPVLLPSINQKIVAVKTLTGGNATVRQTDQHITVSMPVAQRDKLVTVIRVSVGGAAFQITPVPVTQ